MICVIADDFTGAAEIGGVALRYGLRVEVQSTFHADTDVDLICVDADTRWRTPAEAARRTAQVANLCRAAEFTQIFKKVDSVLRGQVASELAALMDAFGKARAVLVPANPSLGRKIVDGEYQIKRVPLHQTSFAQDPEYPATTSNVRSILGPAKDMSVCILRTDQEMPAQGIIIGEAGSHADVVHWAHRLDRFTVPAGAAEFFGAFLETNGFVLIKHNPNLDAATRGNALFVCGSISEYSRSFCRRCEQCGIPVLRMPMDLFDVNVPPESSIEKWVAATVRALEDHTEVMVAIDRPLCRDPGLPQRLSSYVGTAVQQILQRRAIDLIFVEGGATAVALIRQLGWQRMRARHELAPGVVCLQAEGTSGPLLTMKPGSYAWSDEMCAPIRDNR